MSSTTLPTWCRYIEVKLFFYISSLEMLTNLLLLHSLVEDCVGKGSLAEVVVCDPSGASSSLLTLPWT